MSEQSITEQSTLVDALREAVDIVATFPDLPPPYVSAGSWGYADVSWYLQLGQYGLDLDGQKAMASEIVRTLGGKWTKQPGDTFSFKQTRGLVHMEVGVERPAVCERIVTGTETVTIPAVDAKPEQVVEREVVEWRCEPLLAGAQT